MKIKVRNDACHVEMRTGSEKLLCGLDHLWKLMDGGPKLLLQVANTGRASARSRTWMVGCVQQSGVGCDMVSI